MLTKPLAPTGMFTMRCKAHGLIYSVFYGAAPHLKREDAERRVHEFHVTHMALRPDCMLDASIEEKEVTELKAEDV